VCHPERPDPQSHQTSRAHRQGSRGQTDGETVRRLRCGLLHYCGRGASQPRRSSQGWPNSRRGARRHTPAPAAELPRPSPSVAHNQQKRRGISGRREHGHINIVYRHLDHLWLGGLRRRAPRAVTLPVQFNGTILFSHQYMRYHRFDVPPLNQLYHQSFLGLELQSSSKDSMRID
jgi:hypothetical protein